ncbi:unnamed protein product [Paramecium sonneborni]|uniref:Uncharacterized protein n=1 Tax=Paramecium sonneborni TaxID=65129 RepID=A0A8S1MNT5_9CILI|nr:unnamed protein product [Paramecium sonneborni]
MNVSNSQFNQLKPNTLSGIINPNLLQHLQQENNKLKNEVEILKNELSLNNQIIQRIQDEKKKQEEKILELQQQVHQKNQEIEGLGKTIIDQKNLIDTQSDFQEKCIKVQQMNKQLTKLLDELRQNKQIVSIECKPKYQQKNFEETVHLSFTQSITHYQIEYKRMDRKIDFQGNGEILGQGFIFRCSCELSKVPKKGQNPQIIQNDREIYIKFQFDV